MAYCINCGKELPDGAKFCFECGKPISSNKQTERKTIYDGEIHKCPNCGEIINAFELKCSSCGYEIRGLSGAKTLNQLFEQLNKAKDEEQKIEIIRNFPIPNTKEDIVSFMNWAVSNYDGDYAAKHQFDNDISDAYFAVAEKCFFKAKMIFKPNSQEMKSVLDEYNSMCEERDVSKREYEKSEKKTLRKSRKILTKKLIALICIITLALVVSVSIFSYYYSLNIISFNPNAVEIGIESNDMLNKDSLDIIEMLESKGFSNIEKKELEWNSNYDVGSIINITVDGKTKFVERAKFDKLSKIIIKYNGSPKKVQVGITEKNCLGLDYVNIKNQLIEKGFAFIEINEVVWDSTQTIGIIKNIEIKGLDYFDDETEISQDTKIIITVNGNPEEVSLGVSAEDIIGQNYKDIVNLLNSKGFVYIETRNYNAWFSTKDAVKSITINGKSDFSEYTYFSQDSQIVIIYYTNNFI